MSSISRFPLQRVLQTLSSLRFAIILLILLGISLSVGTLILQRPFTDPATLRSVYSPDIPRWLDAAGLTDVFHTRWFVALLALTGLNMVLASIERIPQAWRYFARPYRRPEPAFLGSLWLQKQVPIRSEQQGIEAAERAFSTLGLKPKRVDQDQVTSLFAERHRVSRLAAYIVHASLVLVFAGGIADAIWGYRGFVALGLHDQSNVIESRGGAPRQLPFTLRCDGAGREDYADGSPRRWWSNLAVVEGGQVVARKEIAVNEPLTYRGIRFYQASYGSTGAANAIQLSVTRKKGSAASRNIVLKGNEPVQLDDNTIVRVAAFVPDFVLNGNQIESRSSEPNNPAIQLVVQSKKSEDVTAWLFPRFPNFSHPDNSAYDFQFQDLEMGYFTGLQVAYEPGQWAVWTGFVLAALGLALAFYFVHLRVWAVTERDARGRLVLWVGASASKNREEIEGRFSKLIEKIEANLSGASATLDAARAQLRQGGLGLLGQEPLQPLLPFFGEQSLATTLMRSRF